MGGHRVIDTNGADVFTPTNPGYVIGDTSGTPNVNLPTKATLVGGSDGAKIQALKVDAVSNLLTGLRNSAGLEPVIRTSTVDGIGTSTIGLQTLNMNMIYNGSSAWDRLRSITGTLGVQSSSTSGLSSTAITTAATTAVKAAAGVLGTLSNAGNAITGIITIYDSLSAAGKKIWSGTLTAGQVLPFGIPCGTGITIVTAAADTIAVSFA